jgi:hypothetical protein
MDCPQCRRCIIEIVVAEQVMASGTILRERNRYLVRPQFATRPRPPSVVPIELVNDYVEASAVLQVSPMASAAISRRCLQHYLQKQGFNNHNLCDQIRAATDSGKLPEYIVSDLDAVRVVGNFAAHPMKDQHTGEVLPVEPGEAEWLLDVLEALFEFSYVGPANAKKRHASLQTKQQAAGKKATTPKK